MLNTKYSILNTKKVKPLTWVALGVLLMVAPILYFTMRVPRSAEAAWFHDSWGYRQRIPIDTHTAEETNVYNEMTVDTASLTTDKLRADCDDLRFTKENGQLLPYQIVSGCDTATTTIRVGFDTMPVAPFNIYMYYGNPSATAGSTTLTHAACGNGCAEGTFGSEEKGEGPVAYWKFDEGTDNTCSGGTNDACDGTANENNMAASNTTWQSEGLCISGKCLYFNGSTSNLYYDSASLTRASSNLYESSSPPHGTGVYTTSSFTPADNSLLVVTAGAMENNGANDIEACLTISDSVGLTWTSRVSAGSTTLWADGVVTWTAPVATGTSMTVSIDCGTRDIWAYAVHVANYTSYDTTTPTGATSSDDASATNGVQTMTLSAAPKATSEVLAVLNGADICTGSGGATEGTGWTELNDAGEMQAQARSSSTSTEVRWEDVNTTGSYCTAQTVALEINTDSSAPVIFTDESSFSASGWFRSPDTSSTKYLLSEYNTAGFKAYMNADGTLTCGIDDDSTWSPDASTSSTASYDDNQWHHFACVKNATTSLTLYVDGKQVAQNTSISGVTTTFGGADTYIGVDSNGTSNEWAGFLDEFKIYGYARTAAQVKADYTGKSTSGGAAVVLGQQDKGFLNDGLVGYWPMENNVQGDAQSLTDSSGNSKTATTHYGANTANMDCDEGGKFGLGCHFDGTDDYVDVASPGLPTGDFTYSAWFRSDSITSNRKIVMAPNGTGGDEVYIQTNASVMRYRVDSGTDVDGTTPLSSDTWYHAALTRNGTAITLYLNGSIEATSTDGDTLDFSTCPLYFGLDVDTGNCSSSLGDYWDGLIDEVRVYNRALSSDEVRSLYNWAPGPVGYYKMDEASWTNDCSTDTVFDSSGNGNNGDACPNSTGPTGGVTGKFGKAGSFDGSDDYISISGSSTQGTDTDFTDSFTITAWIKSDKTGTDGNFDIVSRDDNSTQRQYNLHLLGSSGVLRVYANGTTADGTTVLNSGGSTWYHVAATFDRSAGSGNLKVFVNGVQEGSNTRAAALTSYAQGTRIGARASTFFDGTIDDVRLYNYARTSQQIVEDMNAGHPTGGSPIGSQVINWEFNEGYGTTANNQISGGTDGTLTSIASPATSTSGWTASGRSNKAIVFDGTDDNVVIATANDSVVDFNGSEPFSIGAWIYVTSMPVNAEEDAIVAKWDSTSAERAYVLQVENDDADTTGNIRVIIRDDNPSGAEIEAESASDSISEDQWNHVFFTFNGSVTGAASAIKLFINGNNVAESAANVSFAGLEDVTADFTVGDHDADDVGANNTAFTGTIDEVQVYAAELTADQVKQIANFNSSSSFGAGTNEAATLLTDGAGNPPVTYYTFDEGVGTSTVLDRSGNGDDATMNGAMNEQDWVPGKYGNGLDLDGNDDRLTGMNNQGSTSTVTFWVKPNYDWAAQAADIAVFDTAPNQTGALRIVSFDGSSNIVLNFGGAGGCAADPSYTPGNWTNQWHHFALRVNSTTSADLFIDGRLIGNCASSGSSTWISPQIGRMNTNTSFNGIFDEFKIHDYARTNAQIAYDYNRGRPVGWWEFNECQGTVANNSGSGGSALNGTITPGGDGNTAAGTCTSGTSTHMWYNGATGKRGASLDFDGTSDQVDLPATNTIINSNDNWTIGLWFMTPNSDIGLDDRVFMTRRGATGTAATILLEESTDTVDLFYHDGGGSSSIPFTTLANVAGSWHHVATTYDGTTLRLYLDGNQVNSAVDTFAGFGAGTAAIGYNPDASDQYFDGQIDDVRVYNYALSADQIKQIMNDGGGARFGPDTGSP